MFWAFSMFLRKKASLLHSLLQRLLRSVRGPLSLAQLISGCENLTNQDDIIHWCEISSPFHMRCRVCLGRRNNMQFIVLFNRDWRCRLLSGRGVSWRRRAADWKMEMGSHCMNVCLRNIRCWAPSGEAGKKELAQNNFVDCGSLFTISLLHLISAKRSCKWTKTSTINLPRCHAFQNSAIFHFRISFREVTFDPMGGCRQIRTQRGDARYTTRQSLGTTKLGLIASKRKYGPISSNENQCTNKRQFWAAPV